jgi:ElaB/YqjD/DUF883 family membrane-anchored ribosome-binding protein
MTNSTVGKERFKDSVHTYTNSAQHALASGEKVVRKAIMNNPGVALAISAATGVLIACLIKRR